MRKAFRGEDEQRFPAEGEELSPDPGMAFTMAGMISTGTAALDITTAQ